MKLRNFLIGAVAVIVFAAAALMFAPAGSIAQTVGDQNLIRLRFVKTGPTAQGNNALQTGEVSTLSAAVATATLTEVVAAPTAGSIYLRGVWLEKATATTGSVLVRYGTGTNCGTGTTTMLTIGPQTATSLMPIGYYPIGAQVPATKALCLVTDAATTSVRALTN